MIKLETERLILRCRDLSDVQNMFELDSDPEVMRYINGGIPRTLKEIEANFVKFEKQIMDHENDFGCWMADLKDSGRNIGWFILKPIGDEIPGIEVGYRLKREFWGKGYATEGAREMIKYGFETVQLEEIVAITDPENLASQNVLEKCGLTYDRMEKHQDFPVKYFRILKDQYEDQNSH